MELCSLCGKKMPRHILELHMKKNHEDASALGKVPDNSTATGVKLEEAKPDAPVVDVVEGQSAVETIRFDKVIIFCPKFFMSADRELQLEKKGMPVEKKATPAITKDMFKKFWWSIKRNDLKIFDKDVGEYLLLKFGYLVRVLPHEIDKYKKLQADKEYKCTVCAAEHKVFETDTPVAFSQHMKTHNMSPEAMAMIEGMETAKPDGEVYSTADASSGRPRIDEYAGAPTGGTYDRPMVDADGVEWVGPGSVKQQGMRLRPKFGAAGVFRGGVQ